MKYYAEAEDFKSRLDISDIKVLITICPGYCLGRFHVLPLPNVIKTPYHGYIL
jgi:hypothetical protein